MRRGLEDNFVNQRYDDAPQECRCVLLDPVLAAIRLNEAVDTAPLERRLVVGVALHHDLGILRDLRGDLDAVGGMDDVATSCGSEIVRKRTNKN